ncbi:hypothetical protein LJ754_14465 [Arthrobacter sp. zg-Y40]|uniref:hypothetical protein n=1 Tax=Arthrobacter sp. zg-Y40 TaxID=2886939 RepID=UPI001D1549D9|nr:hypothetical protein [Arthrobacter sp. zg-Y40]MCC3280351.1 hypothetical protein [Arthrobacter sp. zg-Y40]
MPQRADPFRMLRAAAATAAILALAVGAHTAGGGSLPAPVLLLALGAFTLAGVTVTTGRRFRPGRLFLVLGSAQLGLHHALAVLAPAAPVSCAPGAAAGHSGMASHHATALECLPAALPAAAEHGLHDAGPALLLAHLAAVVLSTLALARGEDALHAAAAWLRPLFTAPSPVSFPTARPAAISSPAPGRVRSRHCPSRPVRGPPSYALA